VSVACRLENDDEEVGDRSRNDRDDDQQREVARVDQAREHTDHYQHNRAGSDPDHQRVQLPRQRVGHLGSVWRQVLAAEGVLDEARPPRPHRCQAETPVEPGVLLEQAGQDRAEEGAEVDAQVEQREARVASGSSGAYSDPTTG